MEKIKTLKNIIIIRHFKPEINKNIPVSRWTLNDEGIKEMNKLLNTFLFKNITKIHSSPENKALITAKLISNKKNIPLIINKKIKEVDRSKSGFIEGDYKEIAKSYLTNTKFEYQWEDIKSVKKRAKEFINEIERETETIIIVSHGMFLSILLHKYFKKDIVDFWSNLKFGEIIKIDFEKLKKVWNNTDKT